MQPISEDPAQLQKVAQIVHYCDTADLKTLEQIADEIYQYQPFLISLFLGYKDDVDPLQHDKILRVIIIIWLYFRDSKNARRKKITEGMFEAQEKKHLHFLKYFEGEPTEQAKSQLTLQDLKNLKSIELMALVWGRVLQGPALKKMEAETKGITLIGFKALIECFEKISKPSRIRKRRW